MYLVFKNTNEHNELYYGRLMTSPEKLEYVVYVDILDTLSLKEHEPDWKNGWVNSVSTEDIVGIYEDFETLKSCNAQHFI